MNSLITIPQATKKKDALPADRVLRCENTAEFLAALPFMTGYTDGHSLFVVLFRGSRSCGTMRIELPAAQSAADSASLIDGLVRILRDAGAQRGSPALVITTSQSFAEQRGTPWLRFAKRLQRRMKREGWEAREFAVVAADGWCSLRSETPETPRPLTEIIDSSMAQQLRVSEQPPKTLDSVGRLPECDEDRADLVAEHLRAIEERSAARDARKAVGSDAGSDVDTEHSPMRTIPVWLPGTARVAEACFTPTHGRSRDRRIEPRLLARLIDCAQTPDRWLVLALTAMTRAEFVVDLAEECDDTRFESVPLETGRYPRPSWTILELLRSLAQEIPERKKIDRTIAALSDAAAHSPESHRPAILALLAWAWWLRGLQSVSNRFVEKSLAIAPQHELTLTVKKLTDMPAEAHVNRLRDALAA